MTTREDPLDPCARICPFIRAAHPDVAGHEFEGPEDGEAVVERVLREYGLAEEAHRAAVDIVRALTGGAIGS